MKLFNQQLTKDEQIHVIYTELFTKEVFAIAIKYNPKNPYTEDEYKKLLSSKLNKKFKIVKR